MAVTKRDYYEVLSITRTASDEDVKRAYRKAAAANHPDRNPGDDAAVERFKEAAEAFDVLGDTEKRALYDRYGHDAFSRGGRQPGFNDVNDIFGAFVTFGAAHPARPNEAGENKNLHRPSPSPDDHSPSFFDRRP